MGPVNWLAVLLAGLAAGLTVFGAERGAGGPRRLAVLAAAGLIAAAMLGHALARIGAGTLALKPWLYAMQAGGLAGAFVVPALLVNGIAGRRALGWLAAYLAMGAVFWLLG